jgi:hypothetical protein
VIANHAGAPAPREWQLTAGISHAHGHIAVNRGDRQNRFKRLVIPPPDPTALSAVSERAGDRCCEACDGFNDWINDPLELCPRF